MNPERSQTGAMTGFQLEPLPYPQDALKPHISAETLSFHYGKHHKTYVETLNKLVAGSPWEDSTLEDVIVESAGLEDKKAVFNNAAQVWNHAFFWQCMKAQGGGEPSGVVMERIEEAFGSYAEFRDAFLNAATGQFGSGYAWLVEDNATLRVIKTSNADNPMAHGLNALLGCDVWEHAYYLDYQNRRKDFVRAFLDHLVNWEFVESQLT
ncbi:MAG: superoxide dismutase [Kiritimatiellia bacterium]